MFGLEYLMALVRVLFHIGFAIVSAIPVCFCWNRLAVKFFYFLPEVFLKINYWEFVGLFIVVSIIGEYINKIAPKIANISQANSNN